MSPSVYYFNDESTYSFENWVLECIHGEHGELLLPVVDSWHKAHWLECWCFQTGLYYALFLSCQGGYNQDVLSQSELASNFLLWLVLPWAND